MKLFRKALYLLFILIIFGFVLLINYHSNRTFTRVDLTDNKMYSIDPATKDLLRSLCDLVTVEVYFSEQLPLRYQKMKDDVNDIVTEFQVYGGDNLKIEWRDPRPNSIDRQSAVAHGVTKSQEMIVEKDRQTAVNMFAGVAISYAHRTEVIPRIYDTENFEYELIKRISMVLRSERPRVGIFRTDSYNDTDATKMRYKSLFNVLAREYTVDYIDILETHEIDPEITALIIPGGDDSFWSNPYAIAAVDQYFMKGGKLIVLANKIDVNLTTGPYGKEQKSPFFTLLERYGVIVEPKLIFDASWGTLPMQQEVDGKMTMYERPYPLFMQITEDGVVGNNPAFYGFSGMLFHWASPLSIVDSMATNFTVDTLIQSSPMAYTNGTPYSLNPRMLWDQLFTKAENEERLQQFPIAMHLNGSFTSLFAADTTNSSVVRSVENNDIIVIGNSNFIQGGAANASILVNTQFMRNLVGWFTTNDGLISIRNRTFVDRSFVQSSLVDEEQRATTYRVVNILLMPLVVILVGLALFFSRKKAQRESK